MENRSESEKKIYKILVVGDSGVGKTALAYRFCEGTFFDVDKATIGVDFKNKTIVVDGEEITMQIWDTAGQETFRKSLIPNYYRNAHAVIIVYDVTVEATFVSLLEWIEECNIHNIGYDKPKIIVGNKCDGVQTVDLRDALQFANKHNMPLYQTSCKVDSKYDNVETIFLNLAHALKAQNPFVESNLFHNTVGLLDPEPVTQSNCGC